MNKDNPRIPSTGSDIVRDATEEQLAEHRTVDRLVEWVHSFNELGFGEPPCKRSPFLNEEATTFFAEQLRRYVQTSGYIGELPHVSKQAGQDRRGRQA